MDIHANNMEEFNLKEVYDLLFADLEKNKLQHTKHNIYLTNYEMEILSKFHIDFEKCYSSKEILQKIENKMRYLEEEEQADLEQVSMSIVERDYYQNTRK